MLNLVAAFRVRWWNGRVGKIFAAGYLVPWMNYFEQSFKTLIFHVFYGNHIFGHVKCHCISSSTYLSCHTECLSQMPSLELCFGLVASGCVVVGSPHCLTVRILFRVLSFEVVKKVRLVCCHPTCKPYLCNFCK